MSTPEQIARYKAIAKELNERITRREIEEQTADELLIFQQRNEIRAVHGDDPLQLPEAEEVEIMWEDVQTWAAETADHAAKTLISLGWEDSDDLRSYVSNAVIDGLLLPVTDIRFESGSMAVVNPAKAIIWNQLLETNERAFAFPAEITIEQQRIAISQSMEHNGDVSTGFHNAVRGIGAFTAEDDRAATEWIASLSVINDEGRTVLQEHLRAASGPVNNRGDLAGQLQSESARLLRSKSDWELRESDSIFGDFGMPADVGVTGTQAIQDRLQRDTAGFTTEASIKAAIRESLGAAGIPFREEDFPDTEEGKKDFKAAKRIYDKFVNSILDGATASREGLDEMQLASVIATYIDQGTDQFVEATTVQRQNNDFEDARIQTVKDAEAAAVLAEKVRTEATPQAKALADILAEFLPGFSPDDLTPSDLSTLTSRVARGDDITPRDLQAAVTRSDQARVTKERADAATAQAQADQIAAQTAADAISDVNVLRALEDAGYGTAMGTTEYDQFIRQFLPRIRNQLDLIREQNPTVTLDVKALLTGIGPEDAGVTGQFDTAIGGILADIEGFQTPEEFTAEKLRVASPDDALRIRQDLDKIQEEERLLDESRLPQLPVPFQTDDDPNIFGDEQIGADLLPPGVPGLPTLDDTGVISSSALAAQREKALQLEIPDFGEIQDLVAKLSGGDPELQQFIFQNLDIDAIKKSGRDEAERRRQEAFEDAARLSETPEPFEMPDTDPNRLPDGSMDRLIKQREQRSKTPVLTGAQSGRFADRPLPKVKFAPLVEEQLPELTRRFEQSPTQVASRQRKAEVLKEDEKREAELLTARRESKALRGSRTVVSRRARR